MDTSAFLAVGTSTAETIVTQTATAGFDFLAFMLPGLVILAFAVGVIFFAIRWIRGLFRF